MLDLQQYYSVRGQLRPGDVIVFYGATLLDRLIEAASDGPGHSAVVRSPWSAGRDVVIEESTITPGRNGVQHSYLGQRLGGYPAGSSAAALLLGDQPRARIDWFRFYQYIGSIDGCVKYDIAGLFEFLLPQALDRMPSREMVCSVAVAAILAHCGALENVNWAKLRPQDLVELPDFYKRSVPLLGQPPVRNFNLCES